MSIQLRNSRPIHPAGARKLRRKPDLNQVITVTVVLRPPLTAASRSKAVQELARQLPHRKKHLSIEEFTNRHGARKKHLTLVERFAKKHGLQIVQSSRTRRCVTLSGTMAQFAKAFGVQFALHQQAGFTYRSHQDAVRIPSDLRDIVQAVLGLENRPLMEHHAFVKATPSTAHIDPSDVCKAYDFPPNATGKKQRIAIVELGGGYYEADLKAYFESLGLKLPKITCIELDGKRNDPASHTLIQQVLAAMGVTGKEAQKTDLDINELSKGLWTIESTLDIQLAGAFANDAEIVVYYAPNNSQGKYNALTTAIHSEQHPPSVISCSWGAVEDNLTSDFVQAMDQVFQDAALRGITICFSSGDKGEDPDKNGSPRVHFPASSPNVLSCGGTHWLDSDKLAEVVWSEQMPTYLAQTGGGVSLLFDEPQWQSSAGVQSKTHRKGRGVPDVAGKADMAKGYRMIVGGFTVTMGGTSAAVPMWAGLIARFNQEVGKNVGYITPFLYEDPSNAFTDITTGKNGEHYKAEPGWDACTGIGTPIGMKLLSLLSGRTKRAR